MLRLHQAARDGLSGFPAASWPCFHGAAGPTSPMRTPSQAALPWPLAAPQPEQRCGPELWQTQSVPVCAGTERMCITIDGQGRRKGEFLRLSIVSREGSEVCDPRLPLLVSPCAQSAVHSVARSLGALRMWGDASPAQHGRKLTSRLGAADAVPAAPDHGAEPAV